MHNKEIDDDQLDPGKVCARQLEKMIKIKFNDQEFRSFDENIGPYVLSVTEVSLTPFFLLLLKKHKKKVSNFPRMRHSQHKIENT